jgi:hypothetical protein
VGQRVGNKKVVISLLGAYDLVLASYL